MTGGPLTFNTILSDMVDAQRLAAHTGFNIRVFEDAIYVVNGAVLHLLFEVVNRSQEIKRMPRQAVRTWPKTVPARFKFFCGQLSDVGSGNICTVDMLGDVKVELCRRCVLRIPANFCDKGLADMFAQRVPFITRDLLNHATRDLP